MKTDEATMRPMVGYIIFAIASLLAAGTGWCVGSDISFARQMDLLRELREVSTIIFGIVGAWAAIVYPAELKQKLRSPKVTTLNSDQLANFRNLIRCLILSAIIVMTVLVIQYLGTALGAVQLIRAYSCLLRRISFAVTCLLGIGQLWVILLMLIPINSADADVRAAQETKEYLTTGPQGKQGKRK